MSSAYFDDRTVDDSRLCRKEQKENVKVKSFGQRYLQCSLLPPSTFNINAQTCSLGNLLTYLFYPFFYFSYLLVYSYHGACTF